MRAAVVTAFDQPPHVQDVPDPRTRGRDEVVVDVLATGLHPRVRSQASGTHYTSTDTLPLIPGIDGVGRLPDGSLRYFVLPETQLGAMAQRTVIDRRRSIELPADADPVLLAAAMNPAMSSWLALRRRIDFQPGQSVLILGAGGNAGRMAQDVAKRLGAGRVVGAARRGGDISLDPEELARAGRQVDVVLDYLWGEPTADALTAIIPARADDGQRLSWVQIGSMAGLTCPIPSAALRAARLEIVGSGQGSVPPRDILAELPALVAEIGRGSFDVDARAVPLDAVEQVWTAPSAQRVVIAPQA